MKLKVIRCSILTGLAEVFSMKLEKSLKKMLNQVVVTEVFIFVKTLLIVSVITILILKTKLQKLLHLVK